MGRNQHVVPTSDQWVVRGEGNERRTSLNDDMWRPLCGATVLAPGERTSPAETITHPDVIAPQAAASRPPTHGPETACRALTDSLSTIRFSVLL
jgi:hypothetical protein